MRHDTRTIPRDQTPRCSSDDCRKLQTTPHAETKNSSNERAIRPKPLREVHLCAGSEKSLNSHSANISGNPISYNRHGRWHAGIAVGSQRSRQRSFRPNVRWLGYSPQVTGPHGENEAAEEALCEEVEAPETRARRWGTMILDAFTWPRPTNIYNGMRNSKASAVWLQNNTKSSDAKMLVGQFPQTTNNTSHNSKKLKQQNEGDDPI